MPMANHSGITPVSSEWNQSVTILKLYIVFLS